MKKVIKILDKRKAANMKKPNILFLFSDQHNARCLSCAGHHEVKTPNLDLLASEGVRFENTYTNNPICTPSRISFLSGLYPSTHGYYGLYGHAPNEQITSIFKYFRNAGYRTGALGKLHTPRYWIETDCQFIYDEFIEYPKYLEGAGLYEKNDSRNCVGNRDGEISFVPIEHSCEVALAKQAIRFFKNEGEPKDRGDSKAPWLAWVSFSRPHQPYTPSTPFSDMYDSEDISLPPISEDEKGVIRENRNKIPENKLRKMIAAYLGLVSQVDYAIGIILEGLERNGDIDNTVIVYSSDHGDYAGEHGLFEKRGGISYSAICRVPLILRLPDKKNAGLRSDAIIEAVDIFPTLCELAELDIPNTVQGLSFKTILDNIKLSIRDSALTENCYRKAIATKEWRYVANLYNEEEDELYHIKDDPWELNNKINDPKYTEIKNQMLRILLDRAVRARKPITTINGGWHEHRYDLDGRIDLLQNSINTYW